MDVRVEDGNNRPIIYRISGWKEDFIILPDGSMLGRLYLIFKGLESIEQGQIYQPSKQPFILRFFT